MTVRDRADPSTDPLRRPPTVTDPLGMRARGSQCRGEAMLEIGLVSRAFAAEWKKKGIVFFDVQQKFILLNPLKQNNFMAFSRILKTYTHTPVLGRVTRTGSFVGLLGSRSGDQGPFWCWSNPSRTGQVRPRLGALLARGDI